MSFTPGQEKCINTLDRSLVVAAGAGSGKTFTLTKRIVHAIQSGAVDGIDRICAITFTNKAAGELKSRIKAELRACGLNEQALHVDEAWVSTIHGMCARILRAHAIELDLDPTFAMADQVVTDTLRDRAIEQVLMEAQSGAVWPDCDVSAESVDALFAEYPARSYGPRGSSVESMLKTLMAAAGGNKNGFDAFVMPEPRVNPAQLVDAALESYEAVAALAQGQKPNEAREAWAASVAETAAAIRSEMQEGHAGDPLWALRALDRLEAPRKTGTADYKEQVAQALDLYGMCVMELRLAAASSHLATLTALAREAQSLFAASKREAGVLDNDDLLVLASRAIEDHPDIAALYTDKFQLIMVDEFQDTDQMQVDMIKRMAGPNACRLCTVGDAQQSIYRFRGADVSVYRRHLEEVRSANPDDVIMLPDNFRSHRDVLKLVDCVFERPSMFGGEFMSLAPGRDDARVKRPYAPGVPRIRVQHVSTPYKGGAKTDAMRERAAARIADAFADLHDRGHSAGEMAVLLGGMSHADVYASALRDRGLACVITGGSVFSRMPEASMVLDLARVIANPHHTEALHNVLTGPLFELCAGDLAQIATSFDDQGVARRRDLHAGLRACARALRDGSAPSDWSPQLVLALRVMGEAIGASRRSRTSRIVTRAVEDSGLLSRLQDRGAEGLASAGNVYKAIRMLSDIEEAGAAGPAVTARLFESMLAEAKEPPGALSATGGDFVRIMTVHASKGLEFPIVAVAEFKDPRADSSKLLASQIAGNVYLSLDLQNTLNALGPAKVDGRVRAVYASLTQGAVCEDDFDRAVVAAEGALALRAALYGRDELGENEEQKRLLYVALTRAKEALVISLTGKSTKDNPGATPKSVLGAIVPALAGEGGSFDVGRTAVNFGGTMPALVEHEALVLDGDGQPLPADPDGLASASDDGRPSGVEAASAGRDDGMPDDRAVDEPLQDATFFVPARQAHVAVHRRPYAAAHEGVFSYSSIAEASHEGDVLDRLARAYSVSADAAQVQETFDLWLQPSDDASPDFDFAFSWQQANRNAAVTDEDDGSWAYTGTSCSDSDKATDLGTAFHRLAQYAVAVRGASPSATGAGPQTDAGCAAEGFDGSVGAADAHGTAACALAKPDRSRIESLARACRLDEVQLNRLDEALDRWFGSDIAAQMAQFEDLRAEVPFFLPVSAVGGVLDGDGGRGADEANEVFLEGEIDLLALDETGQRARVVDYKTGGRDDETEEDLRRKHVLQAACYAYAIMRQGVSEATADFVRVERARGDAPDQPQCVRYHFAADDIPQLERAIAEVYAARTTA